MRSALAAAVGLVVLGCGGTGVAANASTGSTMDGSTRYEYTVDLVGSELGSAVLGGSTYPATTQSCRPPSCDRTSLRLALRRHRRGRLTVSASSLTTTAGLTATVVDARGRIVAQAGRLGELSGLQSPLQTTVALRTADIPAGSYQLLIGDDAGYASVHVVVQWQPV